MQQTIALNVKQALAAMANERDRIAIAQGQAKANEWYQQQQVQLARDAHQLAIQTQNQNYALAAGGLTGTFGGQPTLAAQQQQGLMTGYYNGTPTLANLGQQAQYTGMYGGVPTLQAQTQQQQYALDQARLALSQLTQQQQNALAQGTLNLATLTQQQRNAIDQANLGLTQAGVTGEFNGRPTLAALAQQQQFGLSQAGVTGTYGGSPTEAARQFNASLALQAGQQSGYLPNGDPTLAREQGAASTALQAAQLGASLSGPENWAQFLQAQNAVSGGPASALVASAPGGLGMMQGDPGGPMTLSKMLTGFGVMPGQGSPQPTQGYGDPGSLRAPSGPIDQTGAPINGTVTGAWSTPYSDPWGAAPGGPINQTGAPIGGGGQGMSPWNLGYYGAPGAGQGAPYGGGAGGYMIRNPDGSWGQGGASGVPDQQMWAGGSPTFNEQTGQYGGGGAGGFMYQDPSGGWQQGGGGTSGGAGSYSAAPAGGMRRQPMPSLWNPGGQRTFANVDPVTGGSTLAGGAMTNSGGGGGAPAQSGGQKPSYMGWNPYSPTGALGQAAQPWQPTSQQLGFNNDDEMNTVKGYFASPNTSPSTWWTSKSDDQKKYLGGLNELWGGSQNTFLERERNARPRQGAWNAAV